MGNELDAYVYDYDAGGNDGCPLLVLTPVEESCHLFCQGRGGGGDTAAAAASNWDFRWDWVTITTLMTIQPRLPSAGHNNHTQQSNRAKERGRERTSQGGGSSGKEGRVLR